MSICGQRFAERPSKEAGTAGNDNLHIEVAFSLLEVAFSLQLSAVSTPLLKLAFLALFQPFPCALEHGRDFGALALQVGTGFERCVSDGQERSYRADDRRFSFEGEEPSDRQDR